VGNGGVDGFVNVLKPPGMSSHDVVAYMRRLLGLKKIGHTGTLDPGAVGVLPLCLGKATRLVEYTLNATKTYRAEMRLGVTTTTGDAYGLITAKKAVKSLSPVLLERALQHFLGDIVQIPPMTSAIHYQGKKLYEWARSGIEVPRTPRKVSIYDLKLLKFTTGITFPELLFEVTCSKGTYIRCLCADLGQFLGHGAFMSFLLRTRAGIFRLEDAYTLEEIRSLVQESKFCFLKPLDQVITHFPRVTVTGDALKKVVVGNPIGLHEQDTISIEQLTPQQTVRLYSPAGQLLALGEIVPGGKGIRMRKVFI
jgi:tRNA pseudouridine55 synthase